MPLPDARVKLGFVDWNFGRSSWFTLMLKPPRSTIVDLLVSLTSGMCEDKQVINMILNAVHVVFLSKETKRKLRRT